MTVVTVAGTVRAIVLSLSAAMLLSVGGCQWLGGSGGRLAASSHHADGAVLSGSFTQSFYAYDSRDNLTFVLIEGSLERPTQAVTIRMFWKPRSGLTPVDSNATNAVIEYMVFSGEGGREVGVYSGAGFLFPQSEPGRSRLNASVWQATLQLSDQSEGFGDLLGKANLRGRFTATRNEQAAQQAIQQLQSLIRERLGYPRLVSGDAPGAT